MIQSGEFALLIGNSDGIGLQLTKDLLIKGVKCIGLSRSDSSIQDELYSHITLDVTDKKYSEVLTGIFDKYNISYVVYLAGIGAVLDYKNLEFETKVFEVNLVSAVTTANKSFEYFLKQGKGHFIGVSSVADKIISDGAPSYCASKAGLSNYLKGLSLSNKNKNIVISNLRFGYVDTKMAKASKKPFLISANKASQIIVRMLNNSIGHYTYPKMILPFVYFLSSITKIQLLFKK